LKYSNALNSTFFAKSDLRLLYSAVSPQFKLAMVAAGCCDVVVQALNAHHEDKCAATLGLEMISTLTGGPGLGESRSDHQHKLRKAGIVFGA
jgi:hypothetical protein